MPRLYKNKTPYNKMSQEFYSNKKLAKANKKMQNTVDVAYNKQNSEAEQLKTSEGDFMNITLDKQMVENLKRQYNDDWKNYVSGSLKAGSTNESKLATWYHLNDAYSRGLASIAAVETQEWGMFYPVYMS